MKKITKEQFELYKKMTDYATIKQLVVSFLWIFFNRKRFMRLITELERGKNWRLAYFDSKIK